MSNPQQYKLNINLISPNMNKESFKSPENTARSTHNETERKTYRHSEKNNNSTFFINSEKNTIHSKNSLKNFHKNSAVTLNHFPVQDKKFYEIKKEFFEKADIPSRNSRNKDIAFNKFPVKGSSENVNNLSLKSHSKFFLQGTLPNIAEDSKNQTNILHKDEKKLEFEKKFLKDFFKKKFPDNLNFEKETFKESKYTNNTDEKLTKRREYSIDRENFIRTNRIKNQETKKFLKVFDNPALGTDYIKSSYGKDIFKLRSHLGEKKENLFKKFYTTKSIGSVLIAKRIRKETDIKKYDNILDNKYTQVSKLKLKWRTIKWILENKAEVVDRLLDLNLNFLNENKHKQTNESKTNQTKWNKGLTRQEFTRVLVANKITHDLDLINKLFWVFDEDGDNELTYQEIAFGIEMFKNSPIEQKLKALFDLCDEDNSGTISKQEFYNLLRKNIINNDEKISMKQVVDKIFSCVKLNKNGEITLDKLKEGCEKNQEIHTIIYKNLLALKSIDNVIDKDIKSDLMKFNPELNIQLRMKLLSMRISYFPLREEKFAKFLDDYVSNKQKRIESEFLKGIRADDDSFDFYDDEDYNLFNEEKNIVKTLKESVRTHL